MNWNRVAECAVHTLVFVLGVHLLVNSDGVVAVGVGVLFVLIATWPQR